MSGVWVCRLDRRSKAWCSCVDCALLVITISAGEVALVFFLSWLGFFVAVFLGTRFVDTENFTSHGCPGIFLYLFIAFFDEGLAGVRI